MTPLEPARCIICENENFTIAEKFSNFQYVRCNSCGFFWQNPLKEEGEFLKIYDQKYFEYTKHISSNSLELMVKSLKNLSFVEFADKNLAGHKFLDIGCSIGFAVKYFADMGWNATGIDVCKEAVEYGKKEFDANLICSDLFEANFSDNSFDVVHSQHVIEHVMHPEQWLKEIHRILKPNGVVLITTPNINSFQRFYFRENWRSYTPRHIQLFGKKILKFIVEKAGFSVHKQISWGGMPQGVTNKFVKKVADKTAKLLNIGDVQLIFAEKKQSAFT